MHWKCCEAFIGANTAHTVCPTVYGRQNKYGPRKSHLQKSNLSAVNTHSYISGVMLTTVKEHTAASYQANNDYDSNSNTLQV